MSKSKDSKNASDFILAHSVHNMSYLSEFMTTQSLVNLSHTCKFFHDIAEEPLRKRFKIWLESSIVCGSSHVFFCKSDGDIWVVGSNYEGQLGLEHNYLVATELQPHPRLNSIQQIACGSFHTVLRTIDDKVWVFGANKYGQLGLGHDRMQNTRQPVPALDSIKIKKVACGKAHTIFLDENGNLLACGKNDHGQLGLNNFEEQSDLARVDYFFENQIKIKDIYCGDEFTMAIDVDDNLYSWGHNHKGQLGLGHSENQNTPQRLLALNGIKIKKIACASKFMGNAAKLIAMRLQGYKLELHLGTFTLFLDQEGNVWKCGNGKLIPEKIPELKDIVYIASGHDHAIALDNNGCMWAWGNNKYGQLGLTHRKDELTPKKIPDLSGIQFAACGNSFTIALDKEGCVFAWGRNILNTQNNVDSQPSPYRLPIRLYGNDIEEAQQPKKRCTIL